jgi:sugar O-acyltransferase (sialic acid O-acetyltransferase NeuD family)
MKNIAIYGAGGFGREMACWIHAINEQEQQWKLIGFFDDGLPIGAKNEYGTILGGINELNRYPQELSIAVAIGNPHTLSSLVNKITNPNIQFPNLIAADVYFNDRNNCSIGKGNLIGRETVLSCNVKIGDFNVFNGNVMVGHDSTIGSYNMFGPHVKIAGSVTIGDNNLFGISSIVLQGKKIGSNTTIAPNSVIVRKTTDGEVYIGNPAIKLKY